MQIKFKAPDPRAGTVAQMDSSRGQHFIDTGSADQVKDGSSVIAANPAGGKKPVLVRSDLDAALAGLPGENDDPDYVIRAMRSHFGELFTDDDELKVRDAVKPAVRKPSEGLTIPQIRTALEAKSIAIPDGVTLRADLAALLDGAPAQ